ncbi:MAG TPA: glutamyl-tRNA reductase [Candidatus Kapabacteria bacterium]|nr:glutamyl-tRNA reductase [Candidatus Kapabacteria bacterium]
MPQNFIAVSISHHRAPVEVRERLQLSEAESRALLGKMRAGAEGLVLSTCNRTEFYAIPERENTLDDSLLILSILAEKQNESHETYRTYFETYRESEAVKHLFRVIAGIDSQIIGDQQIFAQVKDAFRISAEAGAHGSFLNKLSQAAYRVAKRVITETTLNEGAGTISYAAVELARKIYDDLRSRHILVIGAGETGELAAKHFVERGAGHITIANRSIEKANAMLGRIRPNNNSGTFDVIPLAALEDVLPTTDIIISATAAPDYVLTEPVMNAALDARKSSAPVVLIDIAVPRDIDPAIAELPNVFLKDIDDLRTIVDRNAERRQQEIPKAEAIIEEELARFLESLSHLEAGPTIKELREKFETIRSEELERNRAKLDDRSFALMDEMSRRMMNRLLHQPTISLKETNGEATDQLARIEIIRKLFALDKKGE